MHGSSHSYRPIVVLNVSVNSGNLEGFALNSYCPVVVLNVLVNSCTLKGFTVMNSYRSLIVINVSVNSCHLKGCLRCLLLNSMICPLALVSSFLGI